MHVKLRRSAVALAMVACLAALVWASAGSSSTPPQSAVPQPSDQVSAPFGMAAGHMPQFRITHTWVIPVGRRTISVPILMYHYIRTPPSVRFDRLGYNLSVSPADFLSQMDWLAANGYNPVDLNDLRAYFAGKHTLPDRPVVITFDDGYKDLYTTALPILLAHKFKAVAYIVSGFVGKRGYVSSEQVVEMGQNGIEIASHTINHPNLARTSLPMVMVELVASKAWLQHLIGHSVVDFAYPSGKYNAQVVAALFVTGYSSAVTTNGGTYHSLTDRFLWTRIRVGGGESLADFAKNLGPVEKSVEITTVAVVVPAST